MSPMYSGSKRTEFTMSSIAVLLSSVGWCCREDVLKRAENVGRDQLMLVGVCFGKFTKTMKFKLHVTCLDYLAQYAKVSRS